jgi:hypothetical protein
MRDERKRDHSCVYSVYAIDVAFSVEGDRERKRSKWGTSLTEIAEGGG